MTASWIAYGLAVTSVLAIAARLFDRVAELRSWPRRWIWSGALLVAIAFTVAVAWRRSPPPLPVVAPSTAASAPVIDAPRPELPAASVPAPGRLDLSASLGEAIETLQRFDIALVLLWGTGSAALLLMYCAGWWTLRHRRSAWQGRTIDGTDLLIAQHDGPAVAGVLRPRIVLPEWALALGAESRALMIAHEAEHVAARDPLLLQAAIFALVAMPWNFAAWWILRRLRLAVELDCDARVLQSVATPAPRYGELLLTVAEHRSPDFFQVAPALLDNSSSLSQRITAIYPRHFRLPRLQSMVVAATALALLIAGTALPAPRLLAAQGPKAPVVDEPDQKPAPPNAATSLLSGFWTRDSIQGEPKGPRYKVILTATRSWGRELAIDARPGLVIVASEGIAFVQHVDSFPVDGLSNRWLPGHRGFMRATPFPPGSTSRPDDGRRESRELWPGESWTVTPDGRTLRHKYQWWGADSATGWIELTYHRSAR